MEIDAGISVNAASNVAVDRCRWSFHERSSCAHHYRFYDPSWSPVNDDDDGDDDDDDDDDND